MACGTIMRWRQGPPTVGMPESSDLPMPHARQAQAAPRERPRPPPRGPRAIAVFGPKTGCTLLCKLVADAAETPVRIVEASAHDSTAKLIEACQHALGARISDDERVVLIDGAPLDEHEAQALVDERIIDPAVDGCFVRLWAPSEVLVERGMTPQDILDWHDTANRIEQVIFAHLPRNYYMVPNQPETGQDELLTATAQLVRRARIRR